ncbi:hypothetical protein FACS1894218_0840 [Bacilli bacterium]|nr:hypothetical protein FACS1894218_0840 [Bacilli bacterium]
MNKSKNLRSLATNHRKKKGIIVGCTIGGVAAIGLAVGLGIGLTQCNKLPTLSASHHTIGRENATITFTVQNIKNTSSIY